jgi:hypothetical protein
MHIQTYSDQDFPPNMMRDITFPPDSCGGDGRKKGLDIKPLQAYNFSGVGAAESSNSSQHLKWQAHMVSAWMDLCDGALQDMYVHFRLGWICRNLGNLV